MRIVLQRTTGCEVWIDGKLFSSSGFGLLLFVGTKKGDTVDSAAFLADKVVHLRIFEDDAGKMNLSALDIRAEIMIVSQFTLYADTRKGRRPSFNGAQEPKEAEEIYNRFVHLVAQSGLKVQTGQFGASMDIAFTNHGPVTIILEHDV